MSVQVKRGEFQLDPRLLANQQKILKYLQALREEQHSLKQDVSMIKKESKHFQKNVYENFQHMSRDLNTMQECIDDLSSSTDSINNRTKSVYKHVKSINTRHDDTVMSSDTGSNARPRKRSSRDAARPKASRSDGQMYLQPRESQLQTYSPDTVDSETDYSQPLKVNLPRKDYNNSDSNLLHSHSSRSKTGTKHRGALLETQHHKVPIPHSSEDGFKPINTIHQSDIRSPVQLQDQPPENIPKPGTRRVIRQQQKPKRSRNVNQPAILSLNDIMQYDMPQPLLMKTNCSQKDATDVAKKFRLDVVPETLAVIEKATQSRGAPRYQIGLRSVFILDTSESMAGNPFETAKNFLHGVCENLDESADVFALEEYISLITFGEKTSILKPFSNDYVNLQGLFKEEFDNFELIGKSPLLQALAAALCYIECNGDAVILHSHEILPRVVIVSDFNVTNEQNLEDSDVATSEERSQVQQQIFEFMAYFKKRRYQTFCVPVGNFNRNVCQKIASCGGGSVIQPENIEEAGFYYRYQIIVANVLNQYNISQSEGHEEDIDGLVVQALELANMHLEDKDIVLDLLAAAINNENNMDDLEEDEIENDAGAVGGEDLSLPSPSAYQQQASPISLSPSLSDEFLQEESQVVSMAMVNSPVDLLEWRVPKGTMNLSLQEIGRLPQLGSRVQRVKDWAMGNQDGKGPGTVVGHKSEGIIHVLWDNNNQLGSYRFGYLESNYDVEVTKSPRRVEQGQIDIGCWVVRGKDWSKGDEDGGVGTVGVVIRKLPGRNVQVRWPSRVIDTYKFGCDNQWEVKVTAVQPASAEASRNQTPEFVTSTNPHGTGERPAVPGEEGTQYVWQWQDSSHQWRIMSPDSIDKLEMAYKKNPHGNVMVQHKGKNTKVFLSSMEAEIDGRKMPIQREVMNMSDLQNLHMLEEVMAD